MNQTDTTATRPDRRGSAVITLPSDREILITRSFDAPAALVFRAWTTPAFVERWWGHESAPLIECTIDLRVGGSWRYVSRTADGTELGWHGTYREIDAPHRLVSTEVFEGYPDGEALDTLVLDEHDGITTLRITVLHATRENRDGHVNSGMEGGLQASLDRIESMMSSVVQDPGADPTTVAQRYRRAAGRFTDTIAAVAPSAWEQPAPCEGWVARDVVRHLVDWVPGLLRSGAGIELPAGPSVDDDPLGAWTTMSDAIQSVLDDPATTERTFSHPQAGTHPLEQAIGMFILGDVVIHTWDLAHATGSDETLDASEVAAMYFGMLPLDEMLRASGQYGPRVEVPEDADLQTKLIAFTGRRP